MKTLKLPTKR